MSIRKPAPITLLSLDRKIHAVKKEIDLLLKAVELKMSLAGSDAWRECLSHIISQARSMESMAYFTGREDSPYGKELPSLQEIKFTYYQDSINVILNCLLELRSDAITFFEKEGVVQHVTASGKRVSWLKWKAVLESQMDIFESLSGYAKHFSQSDKTNL